MALSRITNPFLSSSGAGNASITSPAANTVAFTTATTERMRINSSGNLGIGTASPQTKIDNTGSFRSTGVGDPTTGAGLELCYRGTVADVLSYNRDTSQFTELQVRGSPIAFINASGERARIPSTGGIQSVNSISVGNATPSTSGAGITFPATQSASSDANTLDDYEEGTWTPALAGEGGGSNTFISKYGYYTKIGRLVTVTFTTSNITSPNAQTNSWNITGLPFQSANLSALQAVLWGGSFSHYRQFPVQASSTGLFPACRPNTATLRISVMYGGPAQTESIYVTGGTPSATLEITGTITYETA